MKQVIKGGDICVNMLSVSYNTNPEIIRKNLSGSGYCLHNQSIVKSSKLYNQFLSGCLDEIPEGYL